MRTIWRIICMILGIAGLTGTILCVAAIIGCWILHTKAVNRTNLAFGRVTQSLDTVRGNLTGVRGELDRTRNELTDLREGNFEILDQITADGTTRRVRFQRAADTVNAKLTEVRRIMQKATDAALIVEGFLSAAAELPLTEKAGIDPETLRDASEWLSDAIQTSERLSTLLKAILPETVQAEIREQLTRLDGLLTRITVGVDAGIHRLDTARERVDHTRMELIRLFTWAAIICTVVLVWIGAGQVSLLIHGFRPSR